MKLILNRFATNRKYNVKESTEILAQYGIAKTEKRTRELIRQSQLRAEKVGHPQDHRSGYEVTEKALYDLVIERIPAMKEIFEKLSAGEDKSKKKKKNQSAAKDPQPTE